MSSTAASPRLGYRVRMLSKAIDARVGARLEQRFGLSLREGLVLVTLLRAPDTHAQDLARLVAIDKTAVSRCIDGLVQRGLIAPAREEHDARFKTYRFSEQGAVLVRRVDAELQAMNRAILDQLAPGDAQVLYPLLDRLSDAVAAIPTDDGAAPEAGAPHAETLEGALRRWR